MRPFGTATHTASEATAGLLTRETFEAVREFAEPFHDGDSKFTTTRLLRRLGRGLT
jgi:hypothetical protein